MSLKDMIEPGSSLALRDVDPDNLDPAHFIGVMLASIAISQKRQADAMERLEEQPQAADMLANLIEAQRP